MDANRRHWDEVLTALIDAGLRIEFLHEFPYVNWKLMPLMEHIDEHWCRLTRHDGSVPLLYSIKARRPRARRPV